MKAQLDVLRAREASATARGLTLPSHGLGLGIALQESFGRSEDDVWNFSVKRFAFAIDVCC